MKTAEDIYQAMANANAKEVASNLGDLERQRKIEEMEKEYARFEKFRQLISKLQSYGVFGIVTASMLVSALAIDRYVRAVDLRACEADSTGEACGTNMLEGVYVEAWVNNRELGTANVITDENGHGVIYPPMNVPREDIFVGPLGGYDYTLTVPLHRDEMGIFHPTQIYCYRGAITKTSSEHLLPRPQVDLIFDNCTPSK